MLDFSVEGKVIVITGATGVLGGAWASSLAEAGAKVVVLARNESKIEDKIKEIKTQGGKVLGVKADVLNEAEVLAAKDKILAHWGRVDGLINAAGGNVPESVVGPKQDLFSLKISDLKKALDLNIMGTVVPTQVFGAVIAHQKKGSILNVSSVTGNRPLTRVMGYGMAKSAIESYTQWLAIEMAQRYGDGIRVNAIAPGFFLTDQNRSLLLNEDGSYAERAQKIVDNTPFGRLGEPEELNETVAYLMSDASRFVTGQTLRVDGGFTVFSGV